MPSSSQHRPKRQGNWVPGPGRPRGSKNRRTVELEEAVTLAAARLNEILPDLQVLDAHGLLVAIYTDPEMPVPIRLEAARAALRVEKPALQATTVNGELTLSHGIADRLGAARHRLSQVVDGHVVNDAATALATLAHSS